MIHNEIKIWDSAEYAGADKDFSPVLSTYILKDGPKKGAVLIFPGGGYSFTSWREAEPIAIWANNAGYNAFVLYYSVSPNRHPQPLLDATRALCLIRDRAEEWNTDKDRIAVCGFSAGGHLAASLAAHYNCDYLKEVRGMEEGKNRPDAVILCYPVITSGKNAHAGSFKNLLGENAPSHLMEHLSIEKHVTDKFPPAFIWSTYNDSAVPAENSLLLAAALRSSNVPFELHIFPDGPHGLSLCNEITNEGRPDFINPEVAVWAKLCESWLKKTL